MARDVIVVVLRHGEKTPDGSLTPRGKRQARKAAYRDLVMGASPDSRIKVYTSKSERAIETGNEIQGRLKKLGFKEYVPRTRAEFIGKIPDLNAFKAAVKKAGGEDAAVEAWLRGTFGPKTMESVSATHKRIRAMLEFPYWMSRWLEPGNPIRLVYVSHNWTMSAMAEHFFGKKFKDLGGPIKFCEPVALVFPAKGKPSIRFRGQSRVLSVREVVPRRRREPKPERAAKKTARRRRR